MINISEAGIEQLDEIIDFIKRIFPEVYGPIIGAEQVEYMLATTHGRNAFKAQLEENYVFLIVRSDENNLIGYAAFYNDGAEIYIRSLYFDKICRGNGMGRVMLEKIMQNYNPQSIKLNVNNQNWQAINFYFKNGFKITGVIDKEIGEGFYMNDFVMVKKAT